MSSVEEALLHLQHLIVKAREKSHNNKTNDSDDNGDHSSTASERVSVGEIEERFAQLEEELFRQEGLQQQAIELHRRAKQRQQEKEKEMDKSDCVGDEISSQANKKKKIITTTTTRGEVSMTTPIPKIELQRIPSTSLSSTASPRQRSSTREATPYTEINKNRETEKKEETSVLSHVIVNLIDGSTQLRGIVTSNNNNNNNSNNNNNNKSGDLHAKKKTMPSKDQYCCFSTPSYSFAQAYANDDQPRLLFVIDQLSHILREERSQKEALQECVIPIMIQHIEKLEREVALQQREIAALKREVALQVELTCLTESSTDNDSDSDSENNNDNNNINHHTDSGKMKKKKRAREGHVADLLLQCEEHLRHLVHNNHHRQK